MKYVTEIRIDLTVDEMRNIFGRNDSYMKKIENNFGVEITDRQGQLRIVGRQEDAQKAADIIRQLAKLSSAGSNIEEQSVDYAITLKEDSDDMGSDKDIEIDNDSILLDIDSDLICHTTTGKPIKPKTLGQKKYVDSIRSHMITFGLGPAGTGKTYLAMAMAITAFQKEEVSRIILTRPAIEAGEKLGFLPGDLQSKVDPYLRPLYDALYQIMGTERFLANMEKGLIEVAPLAYMRGRTLDNAYIILDEAQNTTPAQMKMFLTRIGFGSKVIVTGDATQKDLAPGTVSGLDVAQKVLKDIDDIAVCNLTSKDVVRHPLVQKIVKAYEDYEKKETARSQRKSAIKREARKRSS
ncbi:PhoH family protein [Butyrivibrio fibrisolvens]|uniref:PhoH family protein n=1 Tax=Butyrivibrio fibrisolvens TaxID=831 RepID=UPI0003F6326C|nr:PhoH family protein [Butyrivibrio fibrisolvens]